MNLFPPAAAEAAAAAAEAGPGSEDQEEELVVATAPPRTPSALPGEKRYCLSKLIIPTTISSA